MSRRSVLENLCGCGACALCRVFALQAEARVRDKIRKAVGPKRPMGTALRCFGARAVRVEAA